VNDAIILIENKRGTLIVRGHELAAEMPRQPEYRVNRDGDVKFERIGDEITFGKTVNTRRVDVFPQEDRETYETSAVGIQTADGNAYYISQGVFVDNRNNKKVDLLAKRQADPEFVFPSISIGSLLPYEQISTNLIVPDNDGGIITKVVTYGVASAQHPGGSEMQRDVHDAIHDMILTNDHAKAIRHIH